MPKIFNLKVINKDSDKIEIEFVYNKNTYRAEILLSKKIIDNKIDICIGFTNAYMDTNYIYSKKYILPVNKTKTKNAHFDQDTIDVEDEEGRKLLYEICEFVVHQYLN